MGYDPAEQSNRDEGILGDRKTREGVVKQTFGTMTSVTFRYGANMATPTVHGEEAFFEFHPAYAVTFQGIGWRYSTLAQLNWQSEPMEGYVITLTSPDQGARIEVKKVDYQLPASMSAFSNRVERIPREPWGKEEFKLSKTDRTIFAQWALEQFMLPYLRRASEGESAESVSIETQMMDNREFMVATMRSPQNAIRGIAYGLNEWVYQDPKASGRYRAIVWVATLSFKLGESDPDAIRRFQAIPKSLSFDPQHDLVYSDLQ